MATVTEEKSIPLAVREMVARGKLYVQHAKQLRQKHDAESMQRESDHQKLVSAGSGPVGGSEVQKLQQSRWAILQANEDSLKGLVRELQTILSDRQEQHAESQRLCEQYFDEGVERLVRDFGATHSNAKSRMGGDKDLAVIKQTAHEIHEQTNAVRQMIAACEVGIRAIADERVKLSQKWRTV